MALFLYPNEGALTLAQVISDHLTGGMCFLKLFKNNIIPGRSTVLTDLEEADFDDYVPTSLVGALPPPYIDPTLNGASIQVSTQWSCLATQTTPNTIYGFYIEDQSSGNKIYAIGTFDAPIPMAVLGDAIPLTVKLNYGG